MKKFVLYLFIFLFSIVIIIGCSTKETKENALQYLKKMNEYVQSNDYKEVLRGAYKEGLSAVVTGTTVDEKKISAAIDKKSEEIAISLGFKNSQELEALVEKFKDDKDVKEKSDLLAKSVQSAVEEITKEMTSKLQEQVQKASEGLAPDGQLQK
jgi:hypothetical protein